MYSALLANASFHELLLAYDRDLADTTRARGCGCGGVLHSAKYPRKPRPWALMRRLGPEHHWRFSFCCAVDGCRDRVTASSLGFLGRKVYLAATVVLLSMMSHGVTERRFRRLRELIGVAHVLDDDEPQSAEVGSKAAGLGSSWPLRTSGICTTAGSSRGANQVAVWSSKGAMGLYKRLSANSKGAMGRNRDASPSSRSIASPWSRRSAHAGM